MNLILENMPFDIESSKRHLAYIGNLSKFFLKHRPSKCLIYRFCESDGLHIFCFFMSTIAFSI